MRKKILILCYYFPPNGVIPAWRPYSWANHFSGQGYETHVVCRYWKGGEKSWQDQTIGWPDEHLKIVEHNKLCTIHYLPTDSTLKKILNGVSKWSLISKAFFFLMHAAGNFQAELDTFFSFKKYIRKTFTDDFDYVIISVPPMNLVKLGASLKEKFSKAVFIVDYRDLWDNGLLSTAYKPQKKHAYFNRMAGIYMKQWLKQYDLAISVCQPILDVVSRYSNIKTAVFTNGFEAQLFDGLKKRDSDRFTITSVGTIYPQQDYNILTTGIIQFISKHTNEPIQINIIGARPYNETFCKRFEDEVPASQLLVTGRLERLRALQFVKDADVLFYPGWPKVKGMYSGKIFEYLGSFNNILIAPSDHDAIQQLLDETQTGICKETSEGVFEQLEQWYSEWKKFGKVMYKGDVEKINNYTRESQAQALEKAMIGLTDNKEKEIN